MSVCDPTAEQSTYRRHERVREHLRRVDLVLPRQMPRDDAAAHDVEHGRNEVEELVTGRDERVGRNTCRAERADMDRVRHVDAAALLDGLDGGRAVRHVRDPVHVPRASAASVVRLVLAVRRAHDERAAAVPYGEHHDDGRDAPVGRTGLHGHLRASADDLEPVAEGGEVVARGQGRKKRVADGGEDRVIGELEGGRERKVRRVEKRVCFAVVCFGDRVRLTCSDENIKCRWSVVVNIDREVE